MFSSLSATSSFRLSNNGGMDDRIVARVFKIDNGCANVTGFGKRAIVANPGCRLVFPDDRGDFELFSGCEQRHISRLGLMLLERKGSYAIEYRTCGFYADLPVKIDRGEDYTARCKDVVRYTAHCLVSIRDERVFLSSFGLSHSNPVITIDMVQAELARAAVTLCGYDVDKMGQIIPQRLFSLFKGLGLYLHGTPSISEYTNSRFSTLRDLESEVERQALEAIRDATKANVDITVESVKRLPELMASLAASGLEPEEIDRILAKFRSIVQESSKSVRDSHDAALERKRQYLADAESRIICRDNERMDHVRRPKYITQRRENLRLESGEGRSRSHQQPPYESRSGYRREIRRPDEADFQEQATLHSSYRRYNRQCQDDTHDGYRSEPYSGENRRRQYARNNYQRPHQRPYMP